MLGETWIFRTEKIRGSSKTDVAAVLLLAKVSVLDAVAVEDSAGSDSGDKTALGTIMEVGTVGIRASRLLMYSKLEPEAFGTDWVTVASPAGRSCTTSIDIAGARQVAIKVHHSQKCNYFLRRRAVTVNNIS